MGPQAQGGGKGHPATRLTKGRVDSPDMGSAVPPNSPPPPPLHREAVMFYKSVLAECQAHR